MLIKIGNQAVSAKKVDSVYHSQKGIVRVHLCDGATIEESFNSESEAETHKNMFIQQVNNALKGY